MLLGHTPTYGPQVKLCSCALHKAKPQVTEVGRQVERLRGKLARKLHGVMKDWGAKLAKKAKSRYAELTKSDADVVAAILKALNVNSMAVDLVEELTPSLLRLFKQAGIAGLAAVNLSTTRDITKHLDQAAKDYAEEHGGELVKDLEDSTRDWLSTALTRGVEEGLSPDELSDLIEENSAFSESRADMIARTELAYAHVQGNVEGWRQSEEVEGKRSLLGDLHDIQDECDECADAGVVDLEDDFIPGYDFPPYHPNCICDVLPVLKNSDEGESDEQ